jgi:hypothetical protein
LLRHYLLLRTSENTQLTNFGEFFFYEVR